MSKEEERKGRGKNGEGEKESGRGGGREGVITGHGIPEGGGKDKKSVCLTVKQETNF